MDRELYRRAAPPGNSGRCRVKGRLSEPRAALRAIHG